ncbi:MAG: polysaccharide biosynthesis protein, partial [Rhodospirillales bacterium]
TGLVSLTGTRIGRAIHGIEVLGTAAELPQLAEHLARRGMRPQRLILTKDDLPAHELRQLLETAEQLGMTLARLPRLTEFKDGAQDHIELRPVALEDLLGRPQTVLDRDAMGALVRGKPVLVTGAGGSIGSELVRQIAALEPARLVLLDNSEFNLYAIDLEMGETYPSLPRTALLADMRERARLDAILQAEKPSLVFHAAALKHVPMVEANPAEGAYTNAVGTRHLADACRQAGVEVMVTISTDKAVNPTNIMGATKRLAESYCQALDLAHRNNGPATRFVTVRFGNVLGSTGSVVPLFQRQLAKGGPLTVTHPEVTRFFMTIREAVELILMASALGAVHDSYRGRIFVLDMGEPVKIVDLARQMIRLAGKRPGKDIEIRITGLRPGEKLYEEVLHAAEPTLPTEQAGILVADPRHTDAQELALALDRLEAFCASADDERARALVISLVPEYREPDHHAKETKP